MKKIFGKNQVIITALAVMIAVAGYLSVTQDTAQEVSNIDEFRLDDVGEIIEPEVIPTVSPETSVSAGDETTVNNEVTVNNEATVNNEMSGGNETAANNEITENNDVAVNSESETGINEVGEAVLVSSTIGSQYFDVAKLSREQTRSKNKEILMGLVNSESTSEAQKEKAVSEVIELTSAAEKETAAEAMLEAKGYGNCIVTISDGKADVIVNANNLTEKDIAQIEDVIKRKTEIESKDIVITPVGVTTE